MSVEQRAVDDAISGALREHRQMVTRYVAMVETVDDDGQRWLWTFTSEGMAPWDTVGLLEHGLMGEQNRHIGAEGT